MTARDDLLDLVGHSAGTAGEAKARELLNRVEAEARAVGLDVRPEVVAWFHESEEICDHDLVPWPCQIMADHLLRAFDVTPRLIEHADGTVSFEAHHFRRLELAAGLWESQP